MPHLPSNRLHNNNLNLGRRHDQSIDLILASILIEDMIIHGPLMAFGIALLVPVSLRNMHGRFVRSKTAIIDQAASDILTSEWQTKKITDKQAQPRTYMVTHYSTVLFSVRREGGMEEC